jgi:hypothetical protein
MRLSRLLIAIGTFFSASAFAVVSPGFGPQQSEAAQASPPSTTAEPREPQGTEPRPSSSEQEENAWLSSTPNDSWQTSAQDSEQSQRSGQSAVPRDLKPVSPDEDRSSSAQPVPERIPLIGEQS